MQSASRADSVPVYRVHHYSGLATSYQHCYEATCNGIGEMELTMKPTAE